MRNPVRVDLDELVQGLPILFTSGYTSVRVDTLYALVRELADWRREPKRWENEYDGLVRELQARLKVRLLTGDIAEKENAKMREMLMACQERNRGLHARIAELEAAASK